MTSNSDYLKGTVGDWFSKMECVYPEEFTLKLEEVFDGEVITPCYEGVMFFDEKEAEKARLSCIDQRHHYY